MHSIPPWYIALYESGYILHSVLDVLFIVVSFAVVAVVSRPGWRQHLRWANPAAAGMILNGTDRLSRDIHHYFHVGTTTNAYLTSEILNYGSDFFSLYGLFMLWRTLRDLARHPASPDPLAEHPTQPDVWPPAPTLKR